jgi:hypothetical protein
MKQFDVYHHPIRGYEAVKIGFSWPGFFFSWIWMLFKRLWGWALVCFLSLCVLNVLSDGYYQAYNDAGMIFVILMKLAIIIMVGIFGNELRTRNLMARGYHLITTTKASNPDAAIADVTRE